MADFLWLEYLDVSGCVRVTDQGLDVLTAACTGIYEIHARRCLKVGDAGVIALSLNCKLIKVLDIQDCPLITKDGIADVVALQPRLNILHSVK